MDPNHASTSSAPNTMSADQPSNAKKVIQLNESVYELHTPTGTPSMQILLFHGLQFQDCSDPHFSTWQSRDGSQLWPQTWLVDKFPGAQVLAISYDARVIKGDGKLDLYVIVENLTYDLLTCRANIGQEPGCPVILVGHCFGGLVIKQLCLHMHARASVDSKGVSSLRERKFLEKVRGIFYYATPHHGISGDIAKHFAKGPLLRFVTILSADTARLNSQFDDLQKCYENAWKIAGVVESRPMERGPLRSRVVVSEASAREGESFNVVEDADHISISKPTGKLSRSFYALTNHLDAIVKHSKVELIQEVNLPVHQCQGLPLYPMELAERAQEIVQKLETAPVLGIVGMGGVGKTTLAKEVFNNISKDFEYTCFVDNVKGIEKHQREGWILSQFHCSGIKVDGTKTGWSHLRGKRMLLVLDDVDLEEQVTFLLPLDSFGERSRVIITSRIQSVLKVFGTSVCHEVEFLRDDNAEKLFCKHAFLQEEIPVSFTRRELVGDVVRKCGGLPLTLEVMGRYLRGYEDNLNFWEETIGRLGEAQAITGGHDDKVWATLRVSTDALENGEKHMFISAATYFFEWPLERALAAWSTTCGNSETGWANLVSRCLVKEVCGEQWSSALRKYIEYKTVWVHEHLRDLAGKILSPSNRIDAFSRTSAQELMEQLNFNQVDVETEYLSLSLRPPYDNLSETRGRSKQRMVPCKSLLHMKQLKYVQLAGVLLKGSPKELPSNLSLLTWDGEREEGLEFPEFSNLSLLTWDGEREEGLEFPEFPVSCIEEMQSLAILELKNWQTSHTFPVALGKLTNLRILSLKAIKPVALRKLTDLCTLCVKSRKAVCLLPEDLGQLSRLRRMELVDLGALKLPASFGSLSSLKILRFENIKLSNLPDSFGSLSSLEVLTFRNIELSKLPESFGSLSTLAQLYFYGVQLLELPESFGKLSSLKQLMLDQYVQLSELPESFGKLSSLVELIIKGCANLAILPENFGLLCSLEELTLGSLEKWGMLESLPDTFGQLRALKKLTLYQNKLQLLPSSFCDLESLQELEIWAQGLETLPKKLGALKSLQKLVLRVANVKALPESVGQLSLLRELLFLSYEAETLPQSLGQLDSLCTLSLNCYNMETLPDSLGPLTSLNEFSVDASNLASLPEWLRNFSSLERLEIWHGKFECLPEWLGHLSSLRTLRLWWCEKLKTIPSNLGRWASEEENPNSYNFNRSSYDMELHVKNCPLLDDSVLGSLGWLKTNLHYRKDNTRL